MILWVVSLRRLREHYQSVLANAYRRRLTWGTLPTPSSSVKVCTLAFSIPRVKRLASAPRVPANRDRSADAPRLPRLASQRQGLLYKRGLLNRAWRKRLFIIAAGHLCYFTPDDGAKHLRGKIALDHATVALAPHESAPYAFQVLTSYVMSWTASARAPCVHHLLMRQPRFVACAVRTATCRGRRDRTFVLRADTQADLEAWMAAIDQEKQSMLESNLASAAFHVSSDM